MKRMKKAIDMLLLAAFLILAESCKSPQKDSSYELKENVAISELSLVPLHAGSVKPEGWIMEQMRLDIEKGLAGSYERIWPSVSYELFARQERKPGNVKIMRGKVEGKEPAWWAGEHEGYWKDAIVRLAFLTDNKIYQERAKKWMDDILATAEKSGGYIGIYTPESRFPKEGIDGELWTQSRIFQAMLAYYEFTGDKKVLAAVEKAASLTLNTYSYEIGTYFGRAGTENHGGVSHGIGFLDTLEWLYRLTGNNEYRDGLLWFYSDYSNNKVRDDDMQLKALLEEGRVFYTHTPHIVEGLHGPQICAAFTGEQDYVNAAATALKRLSYHTSPAGNLVGDELVHGRMGTGETLGEYCSMTQGVMAWNRILAWGGTLEIADQIENTVFNAAQAARFHPTNIAVQYLGRDNQYAAADTLFLNGRTIYAGYHRAAACCTLNSTRIMPYYVDGMWYSLNNEPGIFAMLFGPSTLETNISGSSVHVKQETMYPFDDQVIFHMTTDKPVQFKLLIRIPEGAGDVKVDAGKDAHIEMSEKQINIEKKWDKNETIHVDFDFEVKLKTAQDSTLYYSQGPLLYSLPIPANNKTNKELKLINGVKSGFYEYLITPEEDEDYWNLSIRRDLLFQSIKTTMIDSLNPWESPSVSLQGKMINSQGGEKEVTLLPHGSLLLRRLTFPETKK